MKLFQLSCKKFKALTFDLDQARLGSWTVSDEEIVPDMSGFSLSGWRTFDTGERRIGIRCTAVNVKARCERSHAKCKLYIDIAGKFFFFWPLRTKTVSTSTSWLGHAANEEGISEVTTGCPRLCEESAKYRLFRKMSLPEKGPRREYGLSR